MKTLTLRHTAALWMLLAAAPAAMASPPAPLPNASTGVFGAAVVQDLAQVLRQPTDDQRVRLRGHIQEHLRGDKYLFVSDTSRIRVEIDHELQPLVNVTPQTLVEIEGEVEKDFLESPEIDVSRITVLP